ncbi:TRAP transporter small permease [Acuticoccus sp. MNP-M23]|uniref:TRAP transporter small permease n=1 Tax=Acuticoccus sp. MNP-M23 TaxID=3072793 RepID=UPI0028153734|nr:TRAP transporter small permease [Acuticoccus sp. MNP-M23]WMS41410.1 TRAP transporter small permease [Acuticoccus sp. MNP-M23]
MPFFLTVARAALGALDKLVSVAAGIALLIVTFTIFLNATGRYTIGATFLGGEELARLLTVWITFVAAYTMLREDGHVSIDLLVRVVPMPVQRALRGIAALIGTFTMAYLAWRAWQLCAFSFGTGQLGTTLPVPRGLFFAPVCVGAVLMTVAFLEKLVRAITNTLPPLPALADPVDTEPADTQPATPQERT